MSTFVANAPSIYGQLKLRRRKKTQSGSERNTQPDTYVLMEETSRRDSRPRGEDVEDFVSNPTMGSNSLKQGKGEDNSICISETEVQRTTFERRKEDAGRDTAM
jgi:hypothetical protein